MQGFLWGKRAGCLEIASMTPLEKPVDTCEQGEEDGLHAQ